MKRPLQKLLLTQYGEMWPKNSANIKAVLGSKNGGKGIYILYDGSTPVYVGRGNIRSRVRTAKNSRRRGPRWDHFSFYFVSDSHHQQELETLLLRMLPPYLRFLNRQSGKLRGATRHQCKDTAPDPIKRSS
jgi:hypothetical protein